MTRRLDVSGEHSRRRGLVWLVGSAVLALAVWLGGLWYFSPWVAHNDFAILRLRLEAALAGDVGLVGAHSRLGVFHPGPVREWSFAVPYWLSGRRAAALPATALTFNLAWFGIGLFAAWRCRARWIGPTTAVGLGLVVVAMRHQLDSPWNPHLAVVPFFVACAATAMALGGARRAWIASVVGASFAAQLHASAIIVAAALFVTLMVGEARTSRWWRAPLLGAIVWIGPILDLAHGRDANLVRLLTADGGGDRLGLAAGAAAVARLLWLPSIVRSVAIEPGTDAIAGWSRVLLVAVVAALVMVAVRVRGSLRPAAAVALVVIGSSLVTVAVFVAPAYAYLFAPLQAVSAFALVVAVAGLACVAIRTDVAAGWGKGTVALAVAFVAVAVATTDAHDHESRAYRDLSAETAIESWLERTDIVTVWVVDVDVRGADLAALAGDVLVRNDRDPRSNRPQLGLAEPDIAGAALVSAMGAARDCLLAAGAEIVVDGRLHDEVVTMFAVGFPDAAARDCAGL